MCRARATFLVTLWVAAAVRLGVGATAYSQQPATRDPRLAASDPQTLTSQRFTVVFDRRDALLARTLLESATRYDTFPGLPRPKHPVVIEIAADERRFRELIGPRAPEWGSAIAFPGARRIVMQGRSAGSDAGTPSQVLRHELAHLALHESLGDVPPRWFDEGYASYAANEWGRDDVLTANVALVLGRIPPLDSLDAGFSAGARRAAATYALAYRAVAEMATLDSLRGLSLFFEYWKESGKLDPALRRAFTYTQAEFEQLWKKRTRRRYGGLALIADLSLVAVLFAALLVPLYAARRQRDKLRMAALVKADEDAERRDRESAIDALLSTLPPAPPKPPPSTSPDQAPNS